MIRGTSSIRTGVLSSDDPANFKAGKSETYCPKVRYQLLIDLGVAPMIYFASNCLFVLGLMVVGAWLESLGENDGFWDWCLTPLPLGLGGGALVFAERAWG